MEFLGIGPMELLAIILIIVLIFPARQLGQTARALGRLLRNLTRSETWKILQTASDQIQHLPATLMREAELDEIRELQKDLQNDITRAMKPDAPLPYQSEEKSNPNEATGSSPEERYAIEENPPQEEDGKP